MGQPGFHQRAARWIARRGVRQFIDIGSGLNFRARPAVERFFTGLELVSPSPAGRAGQLCYAGDWEAEDLALADSDGSRWLYCGVARLP